jgi:hypothetical protein
MLGLIPTVLDSDIDKNISKAGMMEGTVFVMLRLTKMVQRQKNVGCGDDGGDKEGSDKEWKDHGDN